MKKYILLSGLLTAATMAFAQQEFDAFKYSMTDISGSARYVSMSGAFGALGGDMSTLGMNPAGIAVYRSSEISITPSLKSTKTNSVFNKISSSDTKNNLAIDNFGWVGSFRTSNDTELSNFNFGISFNKIKDYSRNISVIGKGGSYSLITKATDDQNKMGGTTIDLSSLADLMFQGYLINKTTPTYETLLYDGEKFNSTNYLMESGGINEWNLSTGANYAHYFYFGASIGIQSINYNLSSTYTEIFKDGLGFDIRNALTTEGAGVNLKIGVIVRPIPELRIGVAAHTPTYYTMTDIYNSSISSVGVKDENGNPPYYLNEEASFDYILETPSRILYSVAYQFGKKGFLSLDWDIVDYKEMKLNSSDGIPFDDTNSMIGGDFKAVSNLRLGGEYRLSESVSLRGGAAWYQSPVNSSLEKLNYEVLTPSTTPQYGIVKDTYYLSCGIGYRTGGFFLDAALQNQYHNENFYNYYDPTENANYKKYSKLTTSRTNLIVSLGFKF
jgi:hypothetical protein